MPYIKLSRRPALDPIIEALQKRLREQGAEQGEVNYTVTRIALGVLAIKPSYKAYSSAIAALQDAADEIKRRCLAQYEDFAAETNGDVIEFVDAENDIEDRYDDIDAALLGKNAVVQLAAESFKDLQEEIKETFDRR